MVNSVLENGVTVWHNGLGSEMKLEADGNGNLIGTYETAVGAGDGQMPLCGRYNPDEEFPSLGWVVQWKKKGKTLDPKCDGWTCTSWSGQILQKDGKIIIDAVWILTKQTKTKDAWKSHLVNCGQFELITTS